MGDKRSEAATLTNIGGIYDVLGDKHKALDYFEQTADLLHQVGDRWTESLPRYNIARVHEDLGNLAAAEEQLQIAIAIGEALNHPYLEQYRIELARIQTLRRQQP